MRRKSIFFGVILCEAKLPRPHHPSALLQFHTHAPWMDAMSWMGRDGGGNLEAGQIGMAFLSSLRAVVAKGKDAAAGGFWGIRIKMFLRGR